MEREKVTAPFRQRAQKLLFSTYLGKDFQVCLGGFGDGFRVSGIDGGEIHQVSAHAQRPRTRSQEALSGLQRNAARGNELEMRKRRQECLQIRSATDGGAWKDLDVVGARVPGGDGLGWSERAGAGDFAVLLGCGDYFEMEAGAHYELCACIDGCLALIGSGNGAGAKQELRSVFLLEFLQKFYGAGHGHGDFDYGDATGDHGFNHRVGLGRVLCAKNRNQSRSEEHTSELQSLRHLVCRLLLEK